MNVQMGNLGIFSNFEGSYMTSRMRNLLKPIFQPVRTLAVCLLLTDLSVFAIEIDQIDDFNSGGVNGWGGGANPVVGPIP